MKAINGIKRLMGWAGVLGLLSFSPCLADSQPFKLAFPGADGLVDFSKYGKFYGVGTEYYRYIMTDKVGLARALGEGIYPNADVLRDPAYQLLKNNMDIPKDAFGLWAGPSDEAQKNLFRWAVSDQEPAVKLFFAAESFKDAHMWVQALNTYYALLVQFPTATRKNSGDSWSWTASLGNMAIQKIRYILRVHPELGLELKDAEVNIEDVGAIDQKVVKVHPGYFVKANLQLPALNNADIVKYRGVGKVRLAQFKNGHWMMYVDGKPYFIKGICYDVTPVGQSPDIGNWVHPEDVDEANGAFKSWVDKNRNNSQDADEPAIGDPALLRNMGCNTIRIYFGAKSKPMLQRFWREGGIRVAMGVAFGAYALDSGSTWEKGTDYADPEQQQKILDVLEKTVMQYKDEPYILCWVLGNENNYGVGNNANKYPATYCQLVEKACRMVHRLDPDHPVAACVGDAGFFEKVGQFCPDLDIVADNAYRGKEGFGDLWGTAAQKIDRPMLISEYGCPAYSNGKGEDEEGQSDYLAGAWDDINYQRGGGLGVGNSLGGFVFEWMDEWWKAGSTKAATVHDTSKGQWQGPFPDGWSHEEWFGIISQGDGKHSPEMRQLRKSYWTLKTRWEKN